MVRVALLTAALFALSLLGSSQDGAGAAPDTNVTRATLPNGLQVVVVHDSLAPAVTCELTYHVGSIEQQFPGQAHALEHMMFRGTKNVSQTQLFEIAQLMGGDYNANTMSEGTRYYFTIPKQYLDVVLRLDADRMRNLTISPDAWKAESGAIRQEVTQDESNPIQKVFIRTVAPALFKDTPYENDTLGTLDSFDHKIDADALRNFYRTWYHPNNAVYVIAGDVDGPATIERVKKYFGAIPAAKVPPRPAVHLQPIQPQTLHIDSDTAYSLIFIAFRLPGWSDKDYAAAQVMEAVLDDQRADLYGLVVSGKSLYATVQDIDSHSRATAGAAITVVPVTTDPQTALRDLRTALESYRKNGLPAELVQVAKKRAVANSEFASASIEGLANEWTTAVVKRGETSPDVFLDQLKKVTTADVNRVLRKYVDPEHAIVVLAVPKNPGEAHASAKGLAKENNTLTPQKAEPLPAWAKLAFQSPSVPKTSVEPASTVLANGMRLIVVHQSITHTVQVRGGILSDEKLQAPLSKLGVAGIVDGLFSFGTAHYDRIQLRKELDAIAADVNAGTSFSLNVDADNFDRGVALLAEEELHPAFPATQFAILKSQTVGVLTGQAKSPRFLAGVALHKALYPEDDPARRYATPETASAISLDDVHSYYTSVYRPDMTTVVVIGDVTASQAGAAFEKYFGAWHASGPKPDLTIHAAPKNARAELHIPDAARVQSVVELAQTLPLKRSDSDWAVLQLANNVLGGSGFGSMLADDLRTEHGYVYSTDSVLSSSKWRSEFYIVYACDPDKIVPAQELAQADLRTLATTPLSSERLARAKTMMMSDIPLRAASQSAVASQLLGYALSDLPLDQWRIDAQREVAATPQTVLAATQRWIDQGAFVRLVLGPLPGT